MDEYRETIWGIRPKDRGWFQLLTLTGGTAGSIILTLLELDSLSAGAPVSEAARNIALGIGASFVASGFIAWGVLQVKEVPVLIADWIRDATEKRRKRWREEGREEGIEEGIEQGREEGRKEGIEQGRKEGREETLREIYGPDYLDYQEGSRPQPPDADNVNGGDGNDVSNGRPD